MVCDGQKRVFFAVLSLFILVNSGHWSLVLVFFSQYEAREHGRNFFFGAKMEQKKPPCGCKVGSMKLFWPRGARVHCSFR